MKFILLFIAFAFKNVPGFMLNVPINSYKYDYNSQIIKVYEPKLLDKKDMNAIVFYTGANSLIPADIYSNFIRSLNNYNFSVSVVTNNNDATIEMLYNIRDEYREIIPLTHSSGYVNAILTVQKQKNIKKAIFLDPVDNSRLTKISPFGFLDRKKDNTIKYLESILILNAEKSYKGSIFPKLEIPFIPAFALNIKKFQKNNPDLNIEKISAEDYGHSDILDSLWSDLMHATLSRGSDNRDQDNLDEYSNWLSEQIYNFVNHGEAKKESESESESESEAKNTNKDFYRENTVSSEETETEKKNFKNPINFYNDDRYVY